jgi:hypothetical protein
MYCNVFRQFLDAEELTSLQDVFQNLKDRGVLKPFPGDPTRYNCKGVSMDSLPAAVLTIKVKVGELLDVKQYEEVDSRTYVFFSYHLEGGAVHAHAHFPPDGVLELRCNLIVSMPEGGGEPVILDQKVEVGEGDLWVFDSHDRHWSTPVIGQKPRMMLSFGYMVPVGWIAVKSKNCISI